MSQSAEYAHDHPAQLALDGGAYALAERIGLGAIELESTTERRQALAEMQPETFVASIIQLNAVLRGKRPEEGKIEDGLLPTLDTPPPEDKEPLLLETAHTIKAILSDNSLDDKKALRRAGLTLAGGLVYTHPFKDGNGRTSRLAPYLIEFGAERGKELFEAETFSAIGKVAVFEQDFRLSVNTTPSPGIIRALYEYCYTHQPEQWDATDSRGQTTLAVRAFLDAMQGKASIKTLQEEDGPVVEPGNFAVNGRWLPEDGVLKKQKGTFEYEKVPAGSDIVDMYEQDYANMSFAAHFEPHKIPSEAQRVNAVQKSAPADTVILDIGLV